ncbi:MAG: RNA pseudouridine synthase [Rhabdochlamydiaceae bacterium]|jgi:23S rRNA pseudouridine1911/1915/1917 synthase
MKPFDSANIVYCDNHLLVVDKPPGVATQPDLEILAKAWVKKKYQKPGNVFLEPIHRLDKSVGGLVLFARTSKALSRLQALMRERKISKIYQALIEGLLPKKEATLTHYLVHGDHKAFVDPQGKEAILHYHVLEEKNGTTLVSIDLATGRYHQIRAQFAATGHPILGDRKYGSKHNFHEGIALRHVRMEFEHPITHEKCVFECTKDSLRNPNT